MSKINGIKELLEGVFPINLKCIDKYQRKDPFLMDKYENDIYQTGPFCGGSNINLNLITCEDNIVIPLILQKLCYFGTIFISFAQLCIEIKQ